MAMSRGSVSVNDSGVVSGSGCAREIYDEMIDDYLEELPESADEDAQTAVKKSIAKLANKQAFLITYIQTNAEVDGSDVT